MKFISFFNSQKDTLERPAVFGEGDTLFRYNFASKYAKNKKVLDIGTGYGDGAHYFLSKGAKEVVGIDNSKMAIVEAKKKFSQKESVFEIMDALKLKFPKNCFDVVAAFEILEHLPIEKHKVFLENIKSVLKKGGLVFLSTPNKLINSPNTDKPNNPYHIHEFTAEELKALLKKYFSKIEIMGIKAINKEYIKVYNTLGKSFRYKILHAVGKSKLVRELAGFIPKKTRIKLTGENLYPNLTIRDFKMYSNKIKRDECLTLMAIMRQ